MKNSYWVTELMLVSDHKIGDFWKLLFAIDIRSILAFSLPFFLYLTTLAPTIYNLDSAELTTAAATGGIVRSTGYPLYLTMGYFWSKIPLGDVGFRMNLFSAFCGALTILLADRILRHWHVSPLVSFGALGLLATGTFFWGMSLIAEVYTLHTALMAALILALLRWGEKQVPNRMAVICFLIGLGLSHHLATILLIPGCIFFILSNSVTQSITPKSLIPGLVGLFAGLGFYLYIPLRYSVSPAFNYAGLFDHWLQFNDVNLSSLSGLLWLVSARVFHGQMLAYSGLSLLFELREFSILLSQAFFAFGIAPGLLGLFVSLKQNWRRTVMLVLMFFFSAGFYISYRVVDKETMFLPTFLIWALWLGIGYQFLINWMKDNLEDSRLLATGLSLLRGGIVGIVLIALIWNWRITDLSDDRSARELGEEILAVVDENALIFGWWDTVPVVQYLQLVEGQRKDVTAINRFLIPYDEMLIAARIEMGKRPVYVNSISKDILAFANPEPRGFVYELVPLNPNFRGEQ